MAVDGVGSCRVELRCVNNRFLKFALRARDGFAVLEARAEAVVRGRVRRGSVQMTLEFTGADVAGRRLDSAQLGAYLDDLERFCAQRGLPLPATTDALLGLPGVVVERVIDGSLADRAWPVVSVTVPTTVAVPVDCAISDMAETNINASRDNMVPSRNGCIAAPSRVREKICNSLLKIRRPGQSGHSK